MTAELQELIEREAAAAEAEPDEDTETSDEPEPETSDEPVPAPGPTEKELEAREGKLDREDERHAKRIAEIMGQDAAELVPCMMCATRGFLYAAQVGSFPDDHRALIHEQLGEGSLAALEPADDAELCTACRGYGQRRTGSRVPGNETKACSGCGGSGWKAVYRAPEVPPTAALMQPGQIPGFTMPPLPPPQPAQAANGAGDYGSPPVGWHAQGKPGADTWDRWPGHPRYGIDPATGGW